MEVTPTSCSHWQVSKDSSKPNGVLEVNLLFTGNRNQDRRPVRHSKKSSQQPTRPSPHPEQISPQESQQPPRSEQQLKQSPSHDKSKVQGHIPSPTKPPRSQQQQQLSGASPKLPRTLPKASPIAAFVAVAAILPNPIARPPISAIPATLPTVYLLTLIFFPCYFNQL